MKSIILVLGALAIAQIAPAQEHRNQQQVPSNVRNSFQRDYPKAGDTRWSESGGQWHADFTDRSPKDRGEMTAHYDRHGRHIDSHIPYDDRDVPSEVRRRTEHRYPHGRDYSYTRIEHPGGQPLFQVSLNLGGAHKTTYVDDQGRPRTYHDGH
ncbi:MAG TPA: hypothetical protein VGQ51_10730 [Puia sp.]|nr:hypothetical protein [Puia sp.]